MNKQIAVDSVKQSLLDRFKKLTELHLNSRPGSYHDKRMGAADETERILYKFFGVSMDELETVYKEAEEKAMQAR